MHDRPVRLACTAALSLMGAATAVTCAGHQPARAHAIESTLERVSDLTDALVLQSRFSPDHPASDAEVRLVAPDGKTVTLGRTNASGSLQFRIPPGAGPDWELQVDQGPGHRDYLELPAARGNAALPPLRQASLVERTGGSAREVLSQPQPLALAGLLALGGLGGVALRRRQER